MSTLHSNFFFSKSVQQTEISPDFSLMMIDRSPVRIEMHPCCKCRACLQVEYAPAVRKLSFLMNLRT